MGKLTERVSKLEERMKEPKQECWIVSFIGAKERRRLEAEFSGYLVAMPGGGTKEFHGTNPEQVEAEMKEYFQKVRPSGWPVVFVAHLYPGMDYEATEKKLRGYENI